MATIVELAPLLLAGAAIFAVFAVLSLLADLLEWLMPPRNRRKYFPPTWKRVLYLNHTPLGNDRIISVSSQPRHLIKDADEMITSIRLGNPASCTLEDARAILLALEHGDYLKAQGYDEIWASDLHCEIRMLLK